MLEICGLVFLNLLVFAWYVGVDKYGRFPVGPRYLRAALALGVVAWYVYAIGAFIEEMGYFLTMTMTECVILSMVICSGFACSMIGALMLCTLEYEINLCIYCRRRDHEA